MIKYYCDICEKPITKQTLDATYNIEIRKGFRTNCSPSPIIEFDDVCEDCYNAISKVINSLSKPQPQEDKSTKRK